MGQSNLRLDVASTDRFDEEGDFYYLSEDSDASDGESGDEGGGMDLDSL